SRACLRRRSAEARYVAGTAFAWLESFAWEERLARPSHLETIETASGERRAAAQGMLDVARIAREAMRDVDLEAVLQRITEQGLALGAVAAWLYRYAGAEGLLHRAASWRVPEDAVACPASLPADAPDLLALALRTCQAQVVEYVD